MSLAVPDFTAVAAELRRRRQASAASRRWLYDPAGWARECVAWQPGEALTDYQAEVLGQIPAKRRVAVRGPHGLGKTGVAAIVVLWFSTTRDAAGIEWKVITTASVWRQLSVYLWPEIHKWQRRLRWDVIGRPPFDVRRELLDLRVKLVHGAATPVASNDPQKIEGAHADSLLYLLDEAKAIPAGTWESIEGAFSGGRSELGQLPEAFALAFSTPGAPSGVFYDIHSRKPGLEDWWVRHVTLAEAIAAGRISAEWVRQRKLQWGEDSAVYQNRVLGEFAASDEDAVIPLAWVEAAVERWHVWNDAGRPAVDGARVLGVDVARTGRDDTMFADRWGPLIAELVPHRKRDTMAVTALVQADLEPGQVPIVDTIGLGAGVYDRLRELEVGAIGYNGSAKTHVRDRSGKWGFVNTRSAAYWNLRELLDPAFDPELMLPPDDLLLADLTAPTWDITSGVPPKIRVEPKEDLVERLGRSPDRGDAVAMAFWADRSRPAGTASTGREVFAGASLTTGGGNGHHSPFGRPGGNGNGNGGGVFGRQNR